jgi:hypothetical protein
VFDWATQGIICFKVCNQCYYIRFAPCTAGADTCGIGQCLERSKSILKADLESRNAGPAAGANDLFIIKHDGFD